MSATLKMRDYQRECIDALFGAWSDGMKRPAVVLPTGSGKGHPLDTEIVTPDGLRFWGELSPGDRVYGSAGTPVTVTDVYDRGVLPSYQVTFSDGSSVVTDGDHLWSVRDEAFRRTSREHRTVSTSQMAESLKHGRAWRWRIPVSATHGPDKDLPVAPYTLGSLIANGHMSDRSGVTLTTPDTEVIDRVRREHTMTERHVNTDKYCPRYGLTGLNKVIRSLGLMVNSSDKFIPRSYLEAGHAQRLSLLQGLMDGDGSSRSGGRRSVNYHTTSVLLAQDVTELVASLGGTASVSSVTRTRPAPGKLYEELTVHLLLPSGTDPFHSSRKKGRDEPRRTFHPRRSVVSVERVPDQRIRCIRVDAPDHLYQVTRDRIVTHNTVIFSHLIDQFQNFRDGSLGTRVIVLVHRDELADQAIAKIRAVAPHMSVGKVKAQDQEIYADVMVCSVQTISRHARLATLIAAQQSADPVGLIISDECHHSAAKSYQTIYAAFPDALHAGFTATLERGDGVGLGSTWEDVVYSRSLLWMVKHGYLVAPRAYTEDTAGLDLKSVKTTGGDYQSGDLGRALEESDLALSLPAVHKERAGERPTIVFTPTVATAHQLSEAFTAFGSPAAMVSGETPREDRLRIFEDFRLGRTRVLVNCMVLTEGFDAPWASCAVIARPTRSRSLYVQMVGRVLRPWAGKTDALILNVAGAGGKLCTLIDLDPGAVQEVKEGEALDDAEEREAEEEAAAAENREVRARQIKLTETSLFQASHSAWLSTRGGVMFISAGEYTFFLWPSKAEPGRWDVCWMDKRGAARISPHTGLDVEMAMSWAEAEAEDHGSFSVSRKASWRSGKPTQAMLDYANVLGIDPTGMKKAELSDAIGIVKESRRLDPHLARLTG